MRAWLLIGDTDWYGKPCIYYGSVLFHGLDIFVDILICIYHHYIRRVWFLSHNKQWCKKPCYYGSVPPFQHTQESVITVIRRCEDNGQHGTFGSVIGGGGLPQFVSKDLQPYMIKQIDIGNNIFAFEDYIKAIDSANIDCSNKLQFTCNMPFEQLLPKLTVPELWKIVECHKLSLPA